MRLSEPAHALTRSGVPSLLPSSTTIQLVEKRKGLEGMLNLSDQSLDVSGFVQVGTTKANFVSLTTHTRLVRVLRSKA